MLFIFAWCVAIRRGLDLRSKAAWLLPVILLLEQIFLCLNIIQLAQTISFISIVAAIDCALAGMDDRALMGKTGKKICQRAHDPSTNAHLVLGVIRICSSRKARAIAFGIWLNQQ